MSARQIGGLQNPQMLVDHLILNSGHLAPVNRVAQLSHLDLPRFADGHQTGRHPAFKLPCLWIAKVTHVQLRADANRSLQALRHQSLVRPLPTPHIVLQSTVDSLRMPNHADKDPRQIGPNLQPPSIRPATLQATHMCRRGINRLEVGNSLVPASLPGEHHPLSERDAGTGENVAPHFFESRSQRFGNCRTIDSLFPLLNVRRIQIHEFRHRWILVPRPWLADRSRPQQADIGPLFHQQVVGRDLGCTTRSTH